MQIPFLVLIAAATLLHVTAVPSKKTAPSKKSIPYFKPWLETRQSGPGDGVSILTNGQGLVDGLYPLKYPAGNDKDNCPENPANVYNQKSLESKKRSLHHMFKVPERRSLHPRQATNATCQRLGSFSWYGWVGRAANTPTVTLQPPYKYTFSASATVTIRELKVWAAKVNDNDVNQLASSRPNNYTGTVEFTLKEPMSVHFQLFFQYGVPNGQAILFTTQGRGTDGAVAISKERRKRADLR